MLTCVLLNSSEESLQAAHVEPLPKKKKFGAKRKPNRPALAVPNIDSGEANLQEQSSNAPFDAFRSSSPDSDGDEVSVVELDESSSSAIIVPPSEPSPPPASKILLKVPKRKHSKKSKRSRQDGAEQGDDEAVSGDDDASSIHSEPPRPVIEPELPSNDVIIPIEGENGIPHARSARFLLSKTVKPASGSRIWLHASIDEDSPSDGVDLTPLELAKIQASTRRSHNRMVPGIFERQKTVLEAALIPPEDDSANDSMVELGNLNVRDEPPMEAPQPTLIPKYPLEELIPFLTLLAKTYHSYGAPVNRTEWCMREVSEALGVTANYSVMPTLITITFGLPEGMDAVSRTFRQDQTLIAAGHLFEVEKLIDKIRAQQVDLYQARDQLTSIINAGPAFPRPVRLASYALSAASAAVLFFNGGWLEFGVALILGFVVGLIDWAAELSVSLNRVSDVISALIVAAVAVPVSAWVEGSCFSGLVLSSLVWLLPGLTLTLAVRELATKNMVAGTVRMFAAFMTSLKLGFGIAFGSYIPYWIHKSSITTTCADPISGWWYFLFFFTTVIPFLILLDTKYWLWPGQLVTAGIGYVISWALSHHTSMPSELIAVVAAFGVGVTGNLYALWSKTSGIIYIVSGIMLVRLSLHPYSGVARTNAFMWTFCDFSLARSW